MGAEEGKGIVKSQWNCATFKVKLGMLRRTRTSCSGPAPEIPSTHGDLERGVKHDRMQKKKKIGGKVNEPHGSNRKGRAIAANGSRAAATEKDSRSVTLVDDRHPANWVPLIYVAKDVGEDEGVTAQSPVRSGHCTLESSGRAGESDPTGKGG
jgi:hypothetical protein